VTTTGSPPTVQGVPPEGHAASGPSRTGPIEGSSRTPRRRPKEDPARVMRDLARVRPYRVSHLKVLAEDGLDPRGERPLRRRSRSHLDTTMGWLCRAQDANRDGGVAGRYRLDTGWTASYPETTGYIIPTFFEYARLTRQPEHRERAVRMADWLLGIQMPDGAYQGGHIDAEPQPIVFNTAQILKGLVRTYQETGQERYLQAATRAGDWLVSVQDADGAWRRFTYRETPTVYHTTAAWPLLLLHQVVPNPRYVECAVRHLDWACSHQRPTGWFARCAFDEASHPFTHTIAYTVRGLLEAGLLVRSSRYLDAARSAADALLRRYEVTRFLSGQYDERWKAMADYTCVTGNAQTAVIWFRLYEAMGDARYLNGALKMNDTVRAIQDLRSGNPGIRGGVKGSQPIWGDYIRFGYPNWAAKYFADALMAEDRTASEAPARMEP
jgi:hypothetical protein